MFTNLLIGLSNNLWNFIIVAIIAMIAFMSGRQSVLDNGEISLEWFSGFWQNFSTEMIGAFVTFILFQMVTNRREQIQDLLIQMRSKDNATALTATERIVARGWHQRGILNRMYFIGANLEKAQLKGANLSGAHLWESRLKDVNLVGANLEDAFLGEADLTHAYLMRVNMMGADLGSANLSGANLSGANLSKANLGSNYLS